MTPFPPPLRQTRLVLSLGLCASAWLACADFASEDDRRANDPGLEPAMALTGEWDCTTSAPLADPLVYSQATRVLLSIHVIDIFTRATPPNLKVRACLITDLDCERPITADLSADAQGVVNVPLVAGVSGYLELRGDGMAPGLLVLPGPFSPELAVLLGSRAVVLVSDGSAPNAAIPIRSRAMPGTGTLLVTVVDCAGNGAAGVRLEIDSPALPFAIVDGLPIVDEDTTTSYATAGFVNVPPGVAFVSGYRDDTDQIVGSHAVPVRSGWDTLIHLLPDPGVEP